MSVTYRDVLRDGELRTLLSASFVSSAGDVIARIALALLIFDKTFATDPKGSAARAALAFAVTYLSALVGGPLFAGWTDRAPARAVMVVTDVVRGAGLLAMAVIGSPLWLLVLLLFAITTLESPFDAARGVLFADLVEGERYTKAVVADRIVYQGAQALGFALGGVITVVLGGRTALAVDAATFAVSAGLLQLLVRHRPAKEQEASPHKGLRLALADAGTGWRTVLTVPPLRRATFLAWVSAGLGVAPETVTVALALELGGTRSESSLLLALNPVFYILTALWVAERPKSVQRRLLAPLSLLTALPLTLFALRPPVAVGVAVFAVTGVGLASLIVYRGELLAWSPPAQRGRVGSTVGSTLLVLQGVGTGILALLASRVSTYDAVAILGGLLTVAVVAAAASGSRGQPEQVDARVVERSE